jgi:hypothetical protein
MPNNYIKSLSEKGKGSVKSLEKKWDTAKSQAKKQNKDDNYAYITSIFNNIIKEMFGDDAALMINSVEPEIVDVTAEIVNNKPEKNNKCELKKDDASGMEQIYDLLIKSLGDFDEKNIFSADKGIMQIREEDGGGDAGIAANTTSDIAGYETPLTTTVQTRTAPDIGTKYNWDKTKSEMPKSISKTIKKYLKDFNI